MDRLTKKFPGGYGLVKVKDNEQDIESPYPNTLRACFESWQMLGAYEDTGLAPDEIVALKAKLGEFSKAFKGAQAVCEVAISEKKQAIAERDRFKARAEAAEADMKRMADDMDGETDACYPCAICAKNNSRCDPSDNCFEWRGPQEGAAEGPTTATPSLPAQISQRCPGQRFTTSSTGTSPSSGGLGRWRWRSTTSMWP